MINEMELSAFCLCFLTKNASYRVTYMVEMK